MHKNNKKWRLNTVEALLLYPCGMQVCHHRDISVLSETSIKKNTSMAEIIDLKVHLEINIKCTGCKMMY